MSDSQRPIDHSLPGSSIHGIVQARALEWGAIAVSLGSQWVLLKVKLSLHRFTFTGILTFSKSLLYSKSCAAAAAAAKSRQSCPALCAPIDGSPPGSPVPGILQARTLEWVAISSFNA